MKNTDKIVKIINKKYGVNNIDIAIVVGSGQADSVPTLKNPVVIPYDSLGLPRSRVSGHSGKFVVGEYNGKIVATVSRYHYYEAGDIALVRKPFEIIKALGAKLVVLLTSSGGLNKKFKVGDIMLIEDHINYSGINPLIGIDKLEFIPMTNAYDKDYRQKIKQIAKEKDVDLQSGTFIQFSGPTYESMAEVEMARQWGADTVSMSTAHDCIICNYLRMKVIGLSLVVNTYHEMEQEPSHEEVLANAQKAMSSLRVILEQILSL